MRPSVYEFIDDNREGGFNIRAQYSRDISDSIRLNV
jgi:hypothetical protein